MCKNILLKINISIICIIFWNILIKYSIFSLHFLEFKRELSFLQYLCLHNYNKLESFVKKKGSNFWLRTKIFFLIPLFIKFNFCAKV